MKGEKGFSLVEAILTVGLCSIAMLMLIGAICYSLFLNAETKNRLVALNEARRVVEQVRRVADTYGLTGAGSVTSPNVPWNSYIQNILTNETVQVTTSGTDPLSVIVTIGWLEKARSQSLHLTTKVTNR